MGVFIYVLFHTALSNSYGSINHGRYLLLYVGFALLFLPRRGGRADELTRKDVLSSLGTLSIVQSTILLSYTLAGWWKIWHARLELLSPDGMIRILLNRALADTDDVAPLLPFIAQQEHLIQVMLWVTLYIEVFALLVVFRPHLHRPFGISFLLFHLGSAWLMNILFSVNIMMIGLFLVLSPLAPARFSLSGLIQSLPIIGIPFRARARLRSSTERWQVDQAWLVYDGECPLCKNYTQYLRIKESVRELTLVDAREGGPLVEEIRNLPHDLNDGMVLKIKGQHYIGHDALNVLALLSETSGGFSRINRLMFGSPLASRLGYPVLKAGRRILLLIKGVPLLDR